MGGGIVRPARRPPGWIAPGPSPVGPGDDPMLWPQAGEDLCYLVGDWRIFQRIGGHRWSMDDLVTADLARRAVAASGLGAPARFLDLGCGIGSVLLSLAWLFPAARGLGIEAQPVSAALCRRSLRYDGADGRVELREGDLRDAATLPEGAVFDLVTGTPPYFPPGTGTESTMPQRGPCRFEQRGGVEAYCAAAARALAPGGLFVICGSYGLAERIRHGAAEAGLALASRVDVVPRAGKAPLVTLAVLHRADAPPARPSLLADDELTVRDESGQWTARFLEIRAAMGLPPVPGAGKPNGLVPET